MDLRWDLVFGIFVLLLDRHNWDHCPNTKGGSVKVETWGFYGTLGKVASERIDIHILLAYKLFENTKNSILIIVSILLQFS